MNHIELIKKRQEAVSEICSFTWSEGKAIIELKNGKKIEVSMVDKPEIFVSLIVSQFR